MNGNALRMSAFRGSVSKGSARSRNVLKGNGKKRKGNYCSRSKSKMKRKHAS